MHLINIKKYTVKWRTKGQTIGNNEVFANKRKYVDLYNNKKWKIYRKLYFYNQVINYL